MIITLKLNTIWEKIIWYVQPQSNYLHFFPVQLCMVDKFSGIIVNYRLDVCDSGAASWISHNFPPSMIHWFNISVIYSFIGKPITQCWRIIDLSVQFWNEVWLLLCHVHHLPTAAIIRLSLSELNLKTENIAQYYYNRLVSATADATTINLQAMRSSK